jgi:hypothetical protein
MQNYKEVFEAGGIPVFKEVTAGLIMKICDRNLISQIV